jgi:acyl transferase domain-containing protein/NAD(P)H-dependent flavin oxidoreductase YrpB (nitropropane dioxygenase family)
MTPAASLDPAIAIAASRAGGLGVVDFEYARSLPSALACLARACSYADGIGVKLASEASDVTPSLMDSLTEAVSLAVVVPGESEITRKCILQLRAHAESLKRSISIWLEVSCADEALMGEALGVDGLVAKGHEAGGRVAEETAFVLMQRLLKQTQLPVWVHGGIGLHSAAASYAAGAAGVVLDSQLLLTRESPLGEAQRDLLRRSDGSASEALEAGDGRYVRVFARADLEPIRILRTQLDPQNRPEGAGQRYSIYAMLRSSAGWGTPADDVWLLGQDGALAARLADSFRTVAGVIAGVRAAISEHVEAAGQLRVLDEGSPLAKAHGTRYPLVQGPMTRVSDQASFAARVADAGGLPFLALALMRAAEVRSLLERTKNLLGTRPFGVGILGFVPMDLREEQLAAICDIPPAFALIAGGRPDQALTFEDVGIPTYLHVPSPGLLKLFASAGARRFVFEGRECGGHVGPRSSFVLWNEAIDVLLEVLAPDQVADCHLLFAGGIHDATSAQAVSAAAAPLARLGAKVGALMGTAYLFTPEAVASGAILPGFQEEALRCDETALLVSGPGHATRCAKTPFVRTFANEKLRLLARGVRDDELRIALEDLNLGRLRLASKGLRHAAPEPGPVKPRLVEVGAQDQRANGMYMIGQVAALRDTICPIAELHHEVSVGSADGLERIASELHRHGTARVAKPQPSRVAIVGMSCLLPEAPDLNTYWANILSKLDAIREVPAERWDVGRYFDAARDTPDKIYSRYGGFIDDVPFDPIRYGMPPTSLTAIEPLQLLTLEAVRAALDDAGYRARPFTRDRASVILGAGGGVADLGNKYAVRAALPSVFADPPADVLDCLPKWTEDSFAGILLNVAAGRVANRYDLGGVNYTIDAACASSLAAVYAAVRELEAGSSDMVVAGGVDTMQNPFAYLCFSKTQALSPTGRCRPFDNNADGIVISEGLAILVLKRLADAERDGDRIYAVIDAVAGSSDGRGRGLTAPRAEGQMLALKRAYAKAGYSPASVGLVEAHGTGTVVGDQSEIESLRRVFGDAGAAKQSCAIGSVKSMIGHTKCTAGVAGLIKVALALHHKVLPPTMHVSVPNPRARFGESPFYVNTEARPWFQASAETPRRAGVSAFGFGGTNFHAVLEEYTGGYLAFDEGPEQWPSELFVFGGERDALVTAVKSLVSALDVSVAPPLRDLAYTAWRQGHGRRGGRLAVVASSVEDLRVKLQRALQALADTSSDQFDDPRGICYRESVDNSGAIAFLFPGQGSQYVNMLRHLSLFFPEVRAHFAAAEMALTHRLEQPLSSFVYPIPVFSEEEEDAATAALTRTEVAQPALAAASTAIYDLLRGLGVLPTIAGGHSFGEYIALWCAGALDEPELYRLAEARGRCIIDAATGDAGTMAVAGADAATLAPLIASIDGVWLANLNSPSQTVISGTRSGVEAAMAALRERGIRARGLNVACAFHSQVMVPAQERLIRLLSETPFTSPRFDAYSNVTAKPYPPEVRAIIGILSDHLVMPVRFCDQVEAMYAAGARVFVEVGPGRVLTGLVDEVLGGRPHHAVATDVPGKPGLAQLQQALAQLFVQGVDVQLDYLFRGRRPNLLDLTDPAPAQPAATLWVVNGSRARPVGQQANAFAVVTASSTSAEARPDRPVTSPSLLDAPDPRDARRGPARAEPTAKTVAAAASPPRSPAEGADEVMVHFEAMLDRVLSTQRTVMMTYLAANGARAAENGRNQLESGRENGDREELTAPRVPPPRPVPRFVLRAVEAPPTSPHGGLPGGMVFLITDDGRGIATALAAKLAAAGACPVIAPARDLPVDIAAETEERPFAALLDSVWRRHGAINGIVHLAPLRAVTGSAGAGPEARPAELSQESLALFHLARAAAGYLRHASEIGAWFVSATAMGGAFATNCADPPPFAASHGALAGLVKSLACELTGVHCKTIDVDPACPPQVAAAQISAEILTCDDEVEVAYRAQRRLVIRAAPTHSRGRGANDTPFGAHSVFFITGGGRGICAELACALARRYSARFVLAGRTPLGPVPGDLDAGAYTSLPDLRGALIDLKRGTNGVLDVAAVEAEATRLWRAREVRETLKRIEGAGGSPRYIELDVRDARAVQAAVDQVLRTEGRMDVAIHGAGIIEDQLLESKDPVSFLRVFETKVAGALALSRSVPGDCGIVFMSSLTGRFGNSGQTDYAAANAALSKLALYLNQQRRGRVVALEWGPWAGGMADASHLDRFAARGVVPIAVDAGCQAFVEVLDESAGTEPEILFGDGPWPRLEPTGPAVAPLLQGVTLQPQPDGGIQVVRHFGTRRDAFLRGHRIDGRPVLPAAVAAELLAEVMGRAHPPCEVAELSDLQVLKGVTCREDAWLRAVVAPLAVTGNGTYDLKIEDAVNGTLHYRATGRLAARLDDAGNAGPVSAGKLSDLPMSLDEATRMMLFQGAPMRGIESVIGIGPDGAEAVLRPSRPADLIDDAGDGAWLFDPVIIDSALQLAMIWYRLYQDMTPLPSRLARLRRFAAWPSGAIRCQMRARVAGAGHTLTADYTFTDGTGKLLAALDQMELSGSRSLNRLSGAALQETP